MKKIGIAGGVGWQSTMEYYSGICRRSEQRHADRKLEGPASTPEMSIESLDLRKAVAYLGADGDEESWSQFDGYHRAALERLEASGADFAVMASNTPHHRFESIVRGIGIPVIDIFGAMAKASAGLGAGAVLILGTDLTMRSGRLRAVFAKYGIEAGGPREEAARAMTAALIGDLQLGKVDGAAERLGRIAKTSLGKQSGSRIVCLACTELPLAFPEQKTLKNFEYDGAVYINSTAVHIDAAFDFAVKD